jgi:predicted esterase
MPNVRVPRRTALLAGVAVLVGLQAPSIASQPAAPAPGGGLVAGAASGGGAGKGTRLLPPGPGPAFLHEDAPTAPPFQNVGVWEADPLYVMGSQAHTKGEYVYQGFLFDDYGADTGDPRSQPLTGAGLYRSSGDVQYPTDAATYGHNAADLLEFRATRKGGQLRYRITLSTLIQPDVAGVAIGIDTDGDRSTGTDDWGFGLGELGDLGLEHVLVTWGTGAELVSASPACSGCPVRRSVASTVDLERNQIEVVVPLDPGTRTWRHHLVTGLFDAGAGAFRQVQADADASNPGGALAADPPPVFDVGFRHHDQEPWGKVSTDLSGVDENVANARRGEPADHGYWRDATQARALAAKDISAFAAEIDFGMLQRRQAAFDVPRSGYVNAVYGSRFDFGEGILDDGASTMALGRVQPFGLYIPEGYSRDEPAPLFLQLHGGSSPHNQVLSAPNFLREFGEERGGFVLAPLARGPSFGYDDEAELDVLEALAHVRRLYSIDLDRLMVGGPSMGGIGTFNLAGRYPDLFEGAFSIVSGTSSDVLVDNLRHVPTLLWNGAIDPIVLPQVGAAGAHRRLLERGYRHELGLFPTYDHTRHYIEDEWGPAREYLEDQIARSGYPWHVTYHADPASADPQWGLTHDKAYWLSDITVADGAATGKVDAKDLAAGRGAPDVRTYQEHRTRPDVHVASGVQWAEPLLAPRPVNRLQLDLQGVDGVRVWVDATKLDPTRPVELVSGATHAARVTLVSGVGTAVVDVPAGTSTRTVRLR